MNHKTQDYVYRRFGPGFYRGIDYWKVYVSDTDWIRILGYLNALPVALSEMEFEQWKFVHEMEIEVS